VLGLLQTRLELFAVELQEEKIRLIDLLIWITVAISFGVAAIVLAIVTLALLLWEKFGFAGLVALNLVTLLAAVGLVVLVRRKIVHGAGPFSATVAEFQKDAETLRGGP
jgi:uncharacterized membrane protein YqjE